MSVLISLETVAVHLRLDDVDDYERAYLEMLLAAACASVLVYLNRDQFVPWSATQERPPQEVVFAILLVLADMYENRSAQTDKPLSINATVDRLLHFHRQGLGT